MKNILKQQGFSLLEIILAIAIFSLSSVGVGYLIIESGKASEIDNKKINTIFLAREGLEAVRTIRDSEGFEAIDDVGTYALSFDDDSDSWSLTPDGSETVDDIYTREIVIEAGEGDLSSDNNIRKVTSLVSVDIFGRTISTSLTTYLSRWRESL